MKKILVVDNNPVMLEFMNEVLSQEGHTVQTIDNGVEALEISETFIPDVIFVDLIMPYIDGKQLCRLLKRKKSLQNSRIVIISAIAAEDPGFNFSELADAYLAKMPFRVMKPYIINLLEKLDEDTHALSKEIIGLDQIYNRDITKELLFSRQHLEVLLSSITDAFFELNQNNRVIYVNDAGVDFFGMTREELLTVNFLSLFSSELSDKLQQILHSIDENEIEIGVDQPVFENNKYLRLRFNRVSYKNYRSIIVVIQDITSQKEVERGVKDDLKEKELLLKEVHHRVKNNLNVVASLLNLQTTYLKDEPSKKHLTDSKNRVESMALIHEQLYQTEDLSGIFLDSYLNDLVAKIIDIYNTRSTPVKTIINIPPLHLNLTVAVPLGLIINEIISNSLEHGLKDVENGCIEIHLEDEFQLCHLTVHDNGIGLPQNFDLNKNESLGLLLVSNLARQLKGTFDLYNDNGTTASLKFKLEDVEREESFQ